MTDQRRRETDQGIMCRIALRAGQFWDFIDKRDVDKHVTSVIILAGTAIVTNWAMRFAEQADRPGLEVAAIIAAVLVPYNAMQAAALAWYFQARTA